MSRSKRFAHSLVSGYVLLGANMIYTFASVPLALKYLSNAEFALWGLATQIAGYVAMVDFGLSASASRVLIDFKDQRASGEYGSIVKTGTLVGVTQGTLVILVGVMVSLFIAPLIVKEENLRHDFKWLMIGQCVLVGVGFYTRILNHMLTAHQRFDVSNYTSAGLFVMSYAVMWWCFEQGCGVFSTLWGLASGTFIAVGVNWWACAKLKFFPDHGQWGSTSWKAFKELFNYARDFFLFAIGSQLINASQLILLTMLIGLEATAAWSICIRPFLVLSQVVYRIFDYSSAALAEMMVRGERLLLQKRFREIVMFSTSLSVAAAVMLALCNSAFIGLWTSGRINSIRVFPSDIKAKSLEQFIAVLSSPTNAFTSEVWKTVSPEVRTKLQTPPANDEARDELKKTLALELNRTFTNGNLIAAATLDKTQLSEETLALAAGSESKGDAKFRLNRFIFEDLFPEDFSSSRKSHWSQWNDVLLGVWLVICVMLNSHIGLVGQTKEFRLLRYLAFIEGVVFVAMSFLVCRFGGMTLMLVLSIVCSAAIRLPYGWYRTRTYFSIPQSEVVGWHHSASRMLISLLPAAVATWWFTRHLPEITRLCAIVVVMGLWTTHVMARHGLSPTVRGEFLKRVPSRVRPLLSILGFGSLPEKTS